jgi:hypothetical protein
MIKINMIKRKNLLMTLFSVSSFYMEKEKRELTDTQNQYSLLEGQDRYELEDTQNKCALLIKYWSIFPKLDMEFFPGTKIKREKADRFLSFFRKGLNLNSFFEHHYRNSATQCLILSLPRLYQKIENFQFYEEEDNNIFPQQLWLIHNFFRDLQKEIKNITGPNHEINEFELNILNKQINIIYNALQIEKFYDPYDKMFVFSFKNYQNSIENFLGIFLNDIFCQKENQYEQDQFSIQNQQTMNANQEFIIQQNDINFGNNTFHNYQK